MALSGSTSLNKFLDEHTVGALATIVAARLGSVGSSAITGEQRLNSQRDAITVDRFTAHYKATHGGSLPSSMGWTANSKINNTRDGVLLGHLVEYIKNNADIDIAVPTNSVAPVISGTGNGPFTSTTGTWANADSYTYQWYRGATPVSGATTNTLAANAANVGQSITCRVAGVNEAGTATPVASNAIVGA